MMEYRRLILIVLTVCATAMLPCSAMAGVPSVSGAMVTDVTTVSFSVIWASSEASTASLEVFLDETGLTQVPGAVITPHPLGGTDDSIKELAEDNGVMKVRATGLEPDTSYYFRILTTSKSTQETAGHPAEGLLKVTTEYRTTRTYDSGGEILPFSNDIIIEACYLEDGLTAAEGTLPLATVAGSNYPLTAFVGDGIAVPYALIDLNNLFDRENNENLDLNQGISLTLLNFRGLDGNAVVTKHTPEDNSLAEIKACASGLMEGWNFSSFQLAPQENSIAAVLGDSFDNVSALWNYDTVEDSWYKYLREDEYGITDLSEMTALSGYWVVVGEGDETSYTVNGDLLTNQTIPLNSGWNLIGYRSIEITPIDDAIQPIGEEIEAIWTYNTEIDSWQKYLKDDEYGITDLFYLIPGKAYWVVVNNDCDWTP